MSGTGKDWFVVPETGDAVIDGLLAGSGWGGSAITYAFPTLASSYAYSGEPDTNFGAVSALQQVAALFALEADDEAASAGFSVEGFTNLALAAGSVFDAQIRIAQSDKALPTAFAYYPGDFAWSGDVWFSTNYAGTLYDYRDAEAGNYAWHTMLHELGHALGLKHAHEEDGLPRAWDSPEYTVMTYRSYVGGPSEGGYSYKRWDAPQTFMMADIAALQEIYGADYSTNAGNTVYSWNQDSGRTYVNGEVGIDAGGNRIFATIWDGGGIDTYDLSRYSADVEIDLNPGAASVFAGWQLARLGEDERASGSIYNALMADGNTESLIENAWGGSGDDLLVGNQVANELAGNAGKDIIRGLGGGDTLYGGDGGDRFVFLAVTDSNFSDGLDRIRDFDIEEGDRIVLSKIDANVLTAEDDAFSYIGSDRFSGVAGELRFSASRIQGDVDGDGSADFVVLLNLQSGWSEDVLVL